MNNRPALGSRTTAKATSTKGFEPEVSVGGPVRMRESEDLFERIIHLVFLASSNGRGPATECAFMATPRLVAVRPQDELPNQAPHELEPRLVHVITFVNQLTRLAAIGVDRTEHRDSA